MSRRGKRLILLGSLCLGAAAVGFNCLAPASAQGTKTAADECQVYFGTHPVISPYGFSMEINHEHPSSILHACQPTVCIWVPVECLKALRPTLVRCQHLPDKPRVYKACISKSCKLEDLAEGQKAELSKDKGYLLRDVTDPEKGDPSP